MGVARGVPGGPSTPSMKIEKHFYASLKQEYRTTICAGTCMTHFKRSLKTELYNRAFDSKGRFPLLEFTARVHGPS